MTHILQIIFLAFLTLGLISCAPKVSRDELPKRPNIVFIFTDDMRTDDLAYMPKTQALIEEEGATFEHYYANVALCAPSRASVLTGLYAQNHEIYDAEAPNGGFERVYESGLEQSTLAVWLDNAGYNTGLFGKYFATYPNTAEPTYIPPGWDEWNSPSAGYPYDGYDYILNENGVLVEYGSEEDDYITDVLADKSTAYIENALKQGDPFFAYIATYAPHKPSTPAPRHLGMFRTLELPRPPSFNEDNMGDKKKSMLWRDRLTEEDIQYLEEHYRLRAESLQAIDEMVAEIFTILDEAGQLENTYIFFSSDQGIQYGEHRLVEKKNWPYIESVGSPLLIMGPGIRQGISIDNITGNIDIAPTIAELAGVPSAAFVDGRSLLPLLLNEKVEWRDAYLIQRAITDAELSENADWYGLRTERYLYLEFVNDGDTQIYDLKKDPYELENIAQTTDKELLEEYHQWLENLRSCAADECRNFDTEPGK